MKKQEGSKLSEINKAAQVLKDGGVVVFPTDTVYGIGCFYNNEDAVKKIYEIKNRPSDQPLPILVSSVFQAEEIVKVNKLAKKLIEKYWPGGLTIVLESLNGNTKQGVRMPDSEIALCLIKECGYPIIGTSANFHGKPSVGDYKSLDEELIKVVDFVLEGECQGKTESTVVDATGSELIIIRPGAVKVNI